ncbi:hypothetical protein PV11_03146 [Exophiala sideris]|uniref:Uncharacterized protein n=1 Tax=Exophiala sideris TaxID=1016849 RepID=A0A0D1YYD8_9EURO|nr:hypothetical protein PV11_03146 [Exophiala sideris]
MQPQNVDDAGPSKATGKAWQERPFTVVRWGWIALPATLWGLALILLVGTILTTVRENTILWKGSSLAAFSHPLTEDVQDKFSDVVSPREMMKIAEKLDVRWEKTDRGYKLVQPYETA